MATTMDEHRERWEAAFIAAGHTFKMQPEDDGGGGIDWFADYGGMHNGPKCVTCGYSCCVHCTPPAKIPACTPTLSTYGGE